MLLGARPEKMNRKASSFKGLLALAMRRVSGFDNPGPFRDNGNRRLG
jgi:hypothetical protein